MIDTDNYITTFAKQTCPNKTENEKNVDARRKLIHHSNSGIKEFKTNGSEEETLHKMVAYTCLQQ